MASRRRQRQFSDVRLDHSARSFVTSSRIKQVGQKISHQHNKSDANIDNQRTITNNNKSFNDFKNLSKSIKSDKWICFGCYNKDISKAKQERNQKQREMEKSRAENLINDDENHKKTR